MKKYLIFTLAAFVTVLAFSQSKEEGLKRIAGNDDDESVSVIINGILSQEMIEEFEELAEDLAFSELQHLGIHDGEGFDFNFAYDFDHDFNFDFDFDHHFDHDFDVDIDHDFDHDFNFDFDFDHDFDIDIDLDLDDGVHIDLGNLDMNINEIVEDALRISNDAIRLSRDAVKEQSKN